MHHELVVELKQLPEDDVELLSEEDLDGVREVGALEWIAREEVRQKEWEWPDSENGTERGAPDYRIVAVKL